MEEEDTYEPPEDPDSGKQVGPFGRCLVFDYFTAIGLSLEELGMRALQRLPRDKAIDGILAFNKMRFVSTFTIFLVLTGDSSDNLVEYLRPFAQEGQIVKEADVRSFFETLTESARQRRS